jgi:hypothetical protein
MQTLYRNRKVEIYLEDDVVHYKESTLLRKKVYQTPLYKLDKNISFSRTHHFPFFLPPAYLLFLSARLTIKRWETGGWTLYLGLIVMSVILIGIVYYLLIGKNYGEVELQFGDTKLPLYMTKKDYLALQERLTSINQ